MPTKKHILFLNWTNIADGKWRAEHPYVPGWYLLMTCERGNKTWWVKRIQSGPADFLSLVDDSPSLHQAAALASAKLLTQALHDSWFEHSGLAVQWIASITEAMTGLPRAVESIKEACTSGGDDPMSELWDFLETVPIHKNKMQDREIKSLDDSIRKPEAISHAV